MAIRTEDLVLDINPDRMPQADGELTELVVGDLVFAGSGSITLGLDGYDLRRLRLTRELVANAYYDPPAEHTWIMLFVQSPDLTPASGTNRAGMAGQNTTVVGDGNSWMMNSLFGEYHQVAVGEPLVLAGTIDPAGAVAFYELSKGNANFTGTAIYDQTSPGDAYIPAGEIYRVLWYTKALTYADLQPIAAQLMNDYLYGPPPAPEPEPEPEPNPIDDTVPTDGLAMDFNPRTQPGPGAQELVQVTAGGVPWYAGFNNPIPMLISVNQDGFRTAKSTATFVQEEPPAGTDPYTWVYAFKADPDFGGGSTLGRHAASLTINRTRDAAAETDTWETSNFTGSPFEMAFGDFAVLIGILDGPTISWYANGVPQGSGPMNGYLPANAPGFLGSGETFRTLWYDRALTEAEVAEMTALLTEMYTSKRRVTWEAPPSVAPIEAYVVSRLLPSGAVEVVEVAPTALEVEVGAGETILVSARSEHGTSSPVQVVS